MKGDAWVLAGRIGEVCNDSSSRAWRMDRNYYRQRYEDGFTATLFSSENISKFEDRFPIFGMACGTFIQRCTEQAIRNKFIGLSILRT